MHSTDKGIWETIENGPFIPQVKRYEVLIDKPSSDWTEAKSKTIKFDWIAKNIMTFALSCDEFLGYHSVAQQRKCGTSLKSRMKGQTMSSEPESMLLFKSMNFLECRRERSFVMCRRGSLT